MLRATVTQRRASRTLKTDQYLARRVLALLHAPAPLREGDASMNEFAARLRAVPARVNDALRRYGFSPSASSAAFTAGRSTSRP
jgi:hypothetical protein